MNEDFIEKHFLKESIVLGVWKGENLLLYFTEYEVEHTKVGSMIIAIWIIKF